MVSLTVDAHSKWLDIHSINSRSDNSKVNKLLQHLIFQKILVSDNAAAFTSLEFQVFVKQNGIIMHLKTATHHPALNSLAKQAVQIFKAAMKRMHGGSVESKVFCFLFKYIVMLHSTTGASPAELIFGRLLHTHLDLFHPNVKDKVMHIIR